MGCFRHRVPSPRDDVEDALQWVEENIPMAVLSNDNTMSSYPMDSDEEVLNTRFEMSKMEVSLTLSTVYVRYQTQELPFLCSNT